MHYYFVKKIIYTDIIKTFYSKSWMHDLHFSITDRQRKNISSNTSTTVHSSFILLLNYQANVCIVIKSPFDISDPKHRSTVNNTLKEICKHVAKAHVKLECLCSIYYSMLLNTEIWVHFNGIGHYISTCTVIWARMNHLMSSSIHAVYAAHCGKLS